MKQIYYTQCPIGYGLGASNGFQIKRVSPGYPISGDFRHLGMRAFLPGTRTMAPPALRYRRNENGEAEIAWLCPRSHEYETERGLWGRPGGHFAHGILLDNTEFDKLRSWPAGLFDAPLWTRSDRVPSRGEPPAPLELRVEDLRVSAGFEALTGLFQGEPTDWLARLLTSLATVVREGRTLFLIDEPDRLSRRIELLTLAFPPPWRTALTFSTYHDRPEELPGFRIQGSTPAARPNRGALLAHGFVADLDSLRIEPHVEPTAWAAKLAGWLTRREPADRAAWEATERRASIARSQADGAVIWTDEWLDHLYEFDSMLGSAPKLPCEPQQWIRLSRLTRWARDHSLGDELASARPPEWWRLASATSDEAETALLEHLGLLASWTRHEDAPAAWGDTLALWSRPLDPEARIRLFAMVLESIPTTAAPGFVRALINGLTEVEASATLEWLQDLPGCDRALLIPLSVRGAVADALERRETRRIREVLTQAIALPPVFPAVLDAMEAEASKRRDTRNKMAEWIARIVQPAGPRAVALFLRWSLRQEENARAWLTPLLRRIFADSTNQEAWRSVDKLVPELLRHEFVRVLLEVTGDATLPHEAFRWCVEEILLRLPETNQPTAPEWVGLYLERTPSDLVLLKRLFSKEFRQRGVFRWIEAARVRGELSDEQQQRISDCEQYARALRTGDPRSLRSIRLPNVPAVERGPMLKQILQHVDGGIPDSLGTVLEICHAAWPDGFSAGQPGLEGLALVIADAAMGDSTEHEAWLDRLNAIVTRLALNRDKDQGFEFDSLAAELVAAAIRQPGLAYASIWKLREYLLRHDQGWRLLAADVRQDLAGKNVAAQLERLGEWDRHLPKGIHTDRFFEVWLNVCDGAALAACVAARALDLRTLGSIPWWRSNAHVGAKNDLRDALTWLSPMAPLPIDLVDTSPDLHDAFARISPNPSSPEDRLTSVEQWLKPGRPVDQHRDQDQDLIPTDYVDNLNPARSAVPLESGFLSEQGSARWRCLIELSNMYRSGVDSSSCWQSLATWKHRLPVQALELTDRYRFVAWFIRRISHYESHHVARFAKWIFECGLSDVSRIDHWADELDSILPVPDRIKHERASFVRELRVELKQVIRDVVELPRK